MYANLAAVIHTADLDWQQIDGIDIPRSKQFGDVYFSKDNGLLETRHVFLAGNDLSERLAQIPAYGYFCVGETGFGTGLNILALLQLWQQVKPDHPCHLHAISVEKFPLSKTDLIRALAAWPELSELSAQFIAQYPLAIAGCHRLSFPALNFSLDLWLGDAAEVFASMAKTSTVNAWFLDGFSPSCNPDIWQTDVMHHVVRLSDYGSTFASFSVAGVVKTGLQQHGITISRPRGFKHKKQMLKAIWSAPDQALTQSQPQQRQIAIIGAGIAGLSCAWALAEQGHQVCIYEQIAPLCGASGNPLALLNPKLCAIEDADQHLMTLAWQHALRHYRQFSAFRDIAVSQIALKQPEALLSLAQQYPEGVLHSHTAHPFNHSLSSLELLQAGVVVPQQLRDQILAHPHIRLKIAKISAVRQQNLHVALYQDESIIATVDQVVVCCARASAQLFAHYPLLKPIRGQVSWLDNHAQPLPLAHAYSYAGYCMQLDAQQLILGASFLPNREDTEVLLADHQHNLDLIRHVFPAYAQTLPPIETWQGRASVRAQSLDYFPLLGKVDAESEIYTFAGLGSKGFLFAPLCSQILVAMMLKQACPVPDALMQKLSPQRFSKKIKAKKAYFKPPLAENQI